MSSITEVLMSGEELRARREALRLSREVLAREVGCSERTLYRWEAGKTAPQQLTRQAVRQALERLEAERRD